MAIYKEDIVEIELQDGSIFRSFLSHTLGTGDSKANRFGVRLFRNGEPENIGGTCSGYFIRADGETVVIANGTVSGNEAYVELPATCYAIEGQFTLAIKLIGGAATGTMRIVDGVVSQTTTDTIVDPGTLIPSIEELIDAIDDAVASIPADYSTLWTTIAPDFSTSTAYVVGQYVTYNGGMYRFIADHPAGTWNSSHVVPANMGNDVSALKSAFNYYNSVLYGDYYCESFKTPGTYQNGSKVLEAVSFKSGTTYLFTVSDNYNGQNPGYIYLKNGATTNKSFRLEAGETAHFAEWTPLSDYTDDVFVGWDSSNVVGALSIFEKPFFADCLINENESWGE